MPWRSLAVLCLAVAAAALRLAAGQANFTTDAVELAALNSIFRKWNISSSMSATPWNITGDPCSGKALDGVNIYDDDEFNPSIICDCSFNDTCHITRLKAYNLNISGTIPDELQYLTKLNNLQIGRNFLSGPLPAFIGNLTEILYLSIALNHLSGPVPKELGNLKKLISLGIGLGNNFSAPLPSELGNLTNLEQMYIDSSGLSGAIPSTFVNLKKLKILWASDNDFGGRVPDLIGNMINLQSLRLEGNSFEGSIPSNFINLININDLQLCDLSNGSSTLAFIRNMKSLRNLILRNSKISDTIPSDIGEYKGLNYLDLRFNNLTGQLPPSLFNMGSLTSLFIRNNSLSGTLPEIKSPSLSNMNVVANNFTANNSMSFLPEGWECLQRNFPCNRDPPNYSSFAINCGGGENVKDGGIEYESDGEDLSNASYYVTSDKKWAVSTVGTFNYTSSRKVNSLSGFISTSDLKLLESSRFSPSSLRYYGLGLENGNYTIILKFVESIFLNDQTWKSLGKRVFNIYIQGQLIRKDFDIKQEADPSILAAKRDFTAVVTNNYLEVHLLWAGKGTCCVPVTGYHGPIISAISVTPNFQPSFGSIHKRPRALIGGVVAGVATLLLILMLGICFLLRKMSVKKGEDEVLKGLNAIPNIYSYKELKSATKDFNILNKLGEGGFGPVFKGKLVDGKIVAVKKLSEASLQGKKQFVTEVATISAIKHRNLVKLHGCCFEGQMRILVYEYLENKSLDQALFGKVNLQLDWPTRFMICLGTARGLTYLHEESGFRVIHRDIKASNILLDADLTPNISDFGLAKLYDEKMTHISTGVAGTIGYLAPEYAMRGHLTEKADVFAFGVVALEIICGRPNGDASLGPQKMFLLEWTWQLHDEGCELELVDPRLASFDEEEAIRVIRVALLCTQAKFMLRPTMSQVVDMLTGDAEIIDVPCKPSYLSDLTFNSLVGSSSGDASGLTTSQWVLGDSNDPLTSQTQPILSSERSN